MFFSLSFTGLVSLLGGIITYSIIPKFRDMFIKVRESTFPLANLFFRPGCLVST